VTDNAAAPIPVVAPYVRRETFLARVPRKKKWTVTGVAVLLLMASCLLRPAAPSVAPAAAQRPVMAAHRDEKPTEPRPHEENASSLPKPSLPVAEPALAEAASPPPPVATPQAAAIAANDAYAQNALLPHVPDPALVDKSPQGDLPKIAEDGRQAWRVYARPFNPLDPRPRIALVVMGLGLSRVATDATLERLPGPVTLAFDSQSTSIEPWLERARADGHETLIDVPMEPFDYPQSDPGPNTLLTSLPNADNLERLQKALREGTGYIGVTTDTGSRFIANPDKVKPLLTLLRQRGLMLFDAHISPHSVLNDLAKPLGLPVATVARRIDDDPSPTSIDVALRDLEQTARLQGAAVGVLTALPLSLERTQAWIGGLAARGYALAPLSAMVGALENGPSSGH
jgi:polysaccharide deacetylase 2 family uncharacterized protein YibQ